MNVDTASKRHNWPDYKESLVKRGEMYLTFDFPESWDRDLDKFNCDKLGRKYAYPWSFSEFLKLIHIYFICLIGS